MWERRETCLEELREEAVENGRFGGVLAAIEIFGGVVGEGDGEVGLQGDGRNAVIGGGKEEEGFGVSVRYVRSGAGMDCPACPSLEG